MTDVLIAALGVAFLLSVVDAVLPIALGPWRALAAAVIAGVEMYLLGHTTFSAIPMALAAAFGGPALQAYVQVHTQVIVGSSQRRRVPPL